jgi:14-3-3 protein epsilon
VTALVLARAVQMVEYMKKVAEASNTDLSLEERNLLSVAYKNVVGARRASLRIIGSIETKEKEKNSPNAGLVSSYKTKVEAELNTICEDILAVRPHDANARDAA